jgi:hypothetical protein
MEAVVSILISGVVGALVATAPTAYNNNHRKYKERRNRKGDRYFQWAASVRAAARADDAFSLHKMAYSLADLQAQPKLEAERQDLLAANRDAQKKMTEAWYAVALIEDHSDLRARGQEISELVEPELLSAEDVKAYGYDPKALAIRMAAKQVPRQNDALVKLGSFIADLAESGELYEPRPSWVHRLFLGMNKQK